MAAPAFTQPFGATAPRVLQAGSPRTISSSSASSSSAAGSSLRAGIGALRAARLHQFKRPPVPSVPQLASRRQGSLGRQRLPHGVQAQQKDSRQQQSAAEQGSSSLASLGSVGLFLLWGGLVAYAFFLSPNQTPVRDGIMLEYIVKEGVGLSTGDSVFRVNEIFTKLFYVMGIYPVIYTALLFPAGRSGNNVPAWPFVTLSYAFGAFGLLPFMALWTPPKDPPALPPAKKDLEGWKSVIVKGMESPVIGPVLLLSGMVLFYQAATAGADAWADYFKLFDESRFVHATSVDFLTLTALVPFWMSNDAELRKWELRDKLVPVLSVIPVLGPAIYLSLRPKAQ